MKPFLIILLLQFGVFNCNAQVYEILKIVFKPDKAELIEGHPESLDSFLNLHIADTSMRLYYKLPYLFDSSSMQLAFDRMQQLMKHTRTIDSNYNNISTSFNCYGYKTDTMHIEWHYKDPEKGFPIAPPFPNLRRK